MTKEKRNQLIKYAIVVVLVAACFLIPTTDIFTAQVKLYLAVTVFGLALTAFELVPMIAVAIVMPALWVFLGVAPVSVVMSPWTTSTLLMLMGVYFMAATLDDCGLLKRVAYHLMCFTKNNYFALIMMVFLVGVIINIITSGRGHLIMAPLIVGLYKSLDGNDRKLGAGLASAVLLGGCSAHAYTYFSSSVASMAAMCGDLLDQSMATPLKVIFYNSPQFLIGLVVAFVITKMFKPEGQFGELSYFKEQLAAMGPLTKKEKANTLMLIIVLGLVFTADLHKLDVNLIFALGPWIVYLPFLKGADNGTLKKFNVSMVVSCASFMAIGNVAASLGLGAALAGALQGLLTNKTNVFAIMFLIMIIVFVLNKLMTPMAISAVLMKPVAILVAGMGLSVAPFFYAMNSFFELVIFPYEYVPYLVVFSYGMMSMKDFIKFNTVRTAITIVGFFAIQIPFWLLLGIF